MGGSTAKSEGKKVIPKYPGVWEDDIYIGRYYGYSF